LFSRALGGYADGREAGRAERDREIALRLLAQGLAPEAVAAATGLTLEEVEALARPPHEVREPAPVYRTTRAGTGPGANPSGTSARDGKAAKPIGKPARVRKPRRARSTRQ